MKQPVFHAIGGIEMEKRTLKRGKKMTEKVLGFNEEQAGKAWKSNFPMDKRETGKKSNNTEFIVYRSLLVPVVSVERHERLIEALNKSHLKDTKFLIKLRAKERRKVWKLEKELKAVRLQAKTPSRQAETNTTALEQSCKPAVAGKKRVTFKNRYGEDIHFLVRTKPKEAKKK